MVLGGAASPGVTGKEGPSSVVTYSVEGLDTAVENSSSFCNKKCINSH